jgi:hypothetical protein
MPEGIPPPDEFVTSINVLDILTIVLKFAVILCTASWFATIPDGMEIIIAIEKPKAITTNKARIFLLETFLTALVKAPNHSPSYSVPFDPKKGERQAVNFGFVIPGQKLRTLRLFTAAISLGYNTLREEQIIKPFFRIIPNSFHNQNVCFLTSAIDI